MLCAAAAGVATHTQQVMRTVCRSWRDGFDLTVRCITIHSNVLLLPQSPSSFANLQHLVVGHISNSAAQAAIRLLAMPSPSLSVLELSHSMLNAVPPDLQQLVGLKTLVMTSNRLKSLAGGRLHLLPNLEHLDLSNNLLSELPACIGSLGTLRKLNVSENNLAHLPEGLGGLTSLQSLRASNNVLLELPDSLVQLQVRCGTSLQGGGVEGCIQKCSMREAIRVPQHLQIWEPYA